MWMLAELFSYQVVQSLFIVNDPPGQVIFHHVPLLIFFLHPEHDPVSPVIGNIHMKKIIGIARQ